MKSVSHLILIDGYCILCNRLVRWIAKRDTSAKIHYSNIQNSRALEQLTILNAYEWQRYVNPPLTTVVFVQEGHIYYKSEAILQIFKNLGTKWRLLAKISQILPLSLRDYIYDWIARNRLRWFGQKNTCDVADPSLKSLFLDENSEFKLIPHQQESL